MSLLRRVAIALPFAGVGAAAAWCLSSDAPAQRAASLYLIPLRLSRDVAAASSILAGASRPPDNTHLRYDLTAMASCPLWTPSRHACSAELPCLTMARVHF